MSIGAETIAATLPATSQILISALVGATVAGTGALAFSHATRADRRGVRGEGASGIAGKRAFRAHLQSEWTAARHENYEFGVLIIDVDAFGDINHLYGHDVGDRVLAEVAERIKLRVRDGDFVARLDADEFAVICPHTSYDGLMTLRRNLEAYVNYAHSAPVALSIGVGTPHDTDHAPDAVMKRARISMIERRDERPVRAVDEALADLLAR